MKHILLAGGKKLIRALLLLLGVSLGAYLLLCASPLDPLQTNVGQVALGSMSQEQVERLEAYWGVGQPPVQRYLAWLGSAVQGDFGTSLLYREPVTRGDRLSGWQSSLWVLVVGMGDLRRAGFDLGDDRRRVSGTLAGPADPWLLPGDFQHPGILAGAAVAC